MGSFTRQTSFDVAFGNNEAGGCGPVADRARKKTTFSDRLGGLGNGVQTYTFKPASAVSRVHFDYVDVEGNVIEKITPEADYSIQTNITTDCKVIVDFYQTLDGDLRGLTYKNGLIADLYVIYNDAPLGGGVEKKLKLTLFLTDCACGARNTNGDWLNFMCHNLGADHTLDPSSFVIGNADGSGGTLGYLYQWGRQTDGHQKRNSLSTNIVATNDQATLPVGVIGKFVVGAASWRTSNPGFTSLWGDGTTNVNPPKGINDPCPAGWKVPSEAQLLSIFNNFTTPNVWTWTDSGYKVGNALYLPAAGWRNFTSGMLQDNSITGVYWSSRAASFGSGNMLKIQNGSVTIGSNQTASGYSVRCIEE